MKNRVVSKSVWRTERMALLEKEKEFTRLRDEISQQKRALPWVKVDKPYTFQSTTGELSLADLFEGKSQLIVYHFMFGPNYEQGCKSCSFWADSFSPMLPHLNQRDTNPVCISRGPLEKIMDFKKRMGWSFQWVSSQESDFNFDFFVSIPANQEFEYNFQPILADKDLERPGISVFYNNDAGEIFHTYSSYSRGPRYL